MTDRRKKLVLAALAVVLAALALPSLVARRARVAPAQEPLFQQDHVHQATLEGVRLGDAVPLDLDVSLRWRISDVKAFARQFPDPNAYATTVLHPKAREVAIRIANRFPNVQAVFGARREEFIGDLKRSVAAELAEPGLVEVKELILSDLRFPGTLTGALERTALKEHELQGVQQDTAIALERSKAAQLQAEADGKVAISKAEAEGKVAEIAARTEEKQRASALARAETEAQVIERKARAEAARQKQLAQAEAEKAKLLGEAEAERQRRTGEVETAKLARVRDIEVERKRAEEGIVIAREKELAALTATNPAYASFLVSKELATNVQIAVLPTGPDAGSLGSLLQTMSPARRLEKR